MRKIGLRSLAVALLLSVIVLPGSVQAADAKPHWILVSSSHFAVLTDADEKFANQALLRMEQMRAVFAQLLQRDKLTMSEPIDIIAFATREEYARFAPMRDGQPISRSGFFIPGEDRNYIGLDLSDTENWRAVSESLARVYLNYNYPPAQDWFDTGFAAYFSSLRIDEKQASIGDDPASLVPQLTSGAWMTLPDLFDENLSDDQQGPPPAIFKAQSWIMMHSMLSQNKLSETGAYLGLVKAKRMPAEQAVQQAYGMSLAQLDQSVKSYFYSIAPALQSQENQAQENRSRGNQSQAKQTPAANPAHGPVRVFPPPLSSLDVGTSLRRLQDAEAFALVDELAVRVPEHRQQAVEDLKTLLDQPKGETAAAHRALAWVHLQRHEYDDAFEELASATEANPSDPWTRYYLALGKFEQAEDSGNPIQSIPNLMQDIRTVLDWNPDFAEAYNILAMAQLQGGGLHAATDSIRPAIQLNPRSELYVLNLGKIDLEGKKWDDASAIFNRLKDSRDSDIASVAQQNLKDMPMLKKYGVAPQRRADASPAQPAVISNNTDDDPPPDETATPAQAGPDMRKTQFLRGKLLSIDCSQPPVAIVKVANGTKTVKLRTDDYRSLLVIGAGAFSCDWSNQPVTVNYKAGGKSDGDLISLELR